MPLMFFITPSTGLTNLPVGGGTESFLTGMDLEGDDGGTLELGDQLSLDTSGMVQTEIFQDQLLDGGSIMTEPITIGGDTFSAGSLIEADYSAVALDEATGLYYRLTRITITDPNANSNGLNNIEVGIVVSRAFDANLDHFIGGPDGIYPSGAPLTLIDPDPVSDTANWEAFVVDSDYNNGPDGAYSQDVVLTAENGVIICFARGSMIRTDCGELPVEALDAGDMVQTRDHGAQPVRWIGSRRVAGRGSFAPIRIKAGALRNDRDLVVSPQHRMLLDGWKAELLFGESEVLAAATHLVNDRSILREECDEVEYFHILFDRHEIIYANGAPAESFMPGAQGMDSLAVAARDEILTLFPELSDDLFAFGPSARRNLKAFEARLLC